MKPTSESKVLSKVKSFLGRVASPVSTSIRFSLAIAAFVATAVTASAAMQAGKIEVGFVQGNVTSSIQDGKNTPLQKGAILTTGYKVHCGKSSRVELLLANGSRVILQPNSELHIVRFDMEPPKGEVKYEQLSGEPTFSSTLLFMERGKMIVEVLKLKVPVSDFKVRTSFLTADVKGTSFFVEQSNTYAKVGQVTGSVAVNPLQQLGAPVLLQPDQVVIYRLGEDREEQPGGIYGRVQPIDPAERQDAINQIGGGSGYDPNVPGTPMPPDGERPGLIDPQLPVDNSTIITSPNGEGQST